MLELEAQHQAVVLLKITRGILDEGLGVGRRQDEALVSITKLEGILNTRPDVEIVAHGAQDAPPVGQLEADHSKDLLLVQDVLVNRVRYRTYRRDKCGVGVSRLRH